MHAVRKPAFCSSRQPDTDARLAIHAAAARATRSRSFRITSTAARLACNATVSQLWNRDSCGKESVPCLRNSGRILSTRPAGACEEDSLGLDYRRCRRARVDRDRCRSLHLPDSPSAFANADLHRPPSAPRQHQSDYIYPKPRRASGQGHLRG